MIVVFDIDGVLADATHREHHLSSRTKDWDAFFAEVGGDAVIDEGRQRLLAEARGNEVVLLSGPPGALPRGHRGLAGTPRHG